jgi:ligand-binding sensor domain-containing protein
LKASIKYILLFIITFSGLLKSQENNYVFKNYTEKDGISSNFVFCLHKDKNNIIWIGTQNGICRFDGKNFYNFRHRREENSIPNNTVQSLCEDAKGNIWGGTNKGMFYYDVKANSFTRYNAPKGCYSNQITNIICDKSGNIYATTSVEMLTFNHASKQFELIDKIYTDSIDREFFLVWKNSMVIDEKTQSIWISTLQGLYKYDLNTHRLVKPNKTNPELTNSNKMARALTPLSDGNMVFFDNSKKELIFFNPGTYHIIKKVELSHLGDDFYVIAIIEDKNNNKLWLSSFDNRIYTLNSVDNSIAKIPFKLKNGSSISSDFFWDGFVDSNGSVWLGTFSGISVCSPPINIYKPLNLPEKISGLNSNILLISSHPNNGNLYLYTKKNQIISYNRINGQYQIFEIKDFIPNQLNVRPSSINNFHFYDNSIFVTTDDGLWEYDPNSKFWRPFSLLPKTFDHFVVKHMIAAKSDFYVSDGKEILCFNKNTKTVKSIYSKTNSPNTKNPITINYLMLNSKDQLFWAAYRQYIGYYDGEKPVLVKLTNDPSLENVGYFRPAIMDKMDNIWVGFKGIGLYQYNTKNGEIKSWTEFDGWVTSHTHCLVDDENGNIWTAFFNKISYFNSKQGSFINFSIPYSDNNFSYPNSLIKTINGEILTVVGDDVFQLFSSDLSKSPDKILPSFNSINISGRDIFLSGDTTLLLNTEENSIQIKYGLLLDPIAFPHSFEYKLDGFDTNWQEASISNLANYNNLPSGKYTFRVKAKGRNNTWSTEERKISFNIKTPLYKNIYLRAGIFISLVLILISFFKYRMRQYNQLLQLQSKTHHLEKEKAQMMFDSLKQQLNPHFLFNSLTSLSALIDADQAMAGNFLGQMSDMYRYILKNGDAETVSLKDELLFVNTYYQLQKTRFGSGLLLNINVDEQLNFHQIAPVTLQNMMENAIKHNIIDQDDPLIIDIYSEGDYLVVKNNSQPKRNVETSNKKGLDQFKTLYKYLTNKPIIIEDTDVFFMIKIPLINNKTI